MYSSLWWLRGNLQLLRSEELLMCKTLNCTSSVVTQTFISSSQDPMLLLT